MPTMTDALTNRMNFLAAREATVAGNIANANTPGYLSRDLVAPRNGDTGSFGMAVTNAQHMQAAKSSPAGEVVTDDTYMQHNGNSVRLDSEMLKLSDVQLNYRLMTELYSKQVAMQKTAIGRTQ
jgi:flagellar basal-body rod protein FlgB